MAGVMISTAVLTGALVVGDSVRYSLQRITGVRLGTIGYALQPGDRYFRQELAGEISGITGSRAAPAIQCGAIAINSDKNLRINQVQVTGIDQRFMGFWDLAQPAPREDEAVISRNVADRLGLVIGDELLLRLRKQGKAPPNAPFSAEREPSVSFRVKVTFIARDEQMGRFSLKSNQTAPFNIFISITQLAVGLEIAGYANLLVAGESSDRTVKSPGPDSALRMCWKPQLPNGTS